MKYNRVNLLALLLIVITLITTNTSISAKTFEDGWYGFANSTNKDREAELRQHVGPFERIYWRDGSFNKLCMILDKDCVKVIDWEGNEKPCNENPFDGSRVALCRNNLSFPTHSVLDCGSPTELKIQCDRANRGSTITITNPRTGEWENISWEKNSGFGLGRILESAFIRLDIPYCCLNTLGNGILIPKGVRVQVQVSGSCWTEYIRR